MPDCFWRTHTCVLLLPNTDDRPKSLYQQAHCVQLRVRLNPNLHLITRLESRDLRDLIDLLPGKKENLRYQSYRAPQLAHLTG